MRTARFVNAQLSTGVSRVPRDDDGVFSPFIYRLARWLESSGVTMYLFAELPGDVVGRYDDTVPSICIDTATAECALVVLAHEAGHWLGYRMFGEKQHSYQRERQAFVYGWRVLQLIGAAGTVVSRETWIRDGR